MYRSALFPLSHFASWRLILLLFCWTASVTVRADGAPWLVVDTATLTLTVMEADKSVQHYDNISIGRRGAAVDKRRRDDHTPLGEYRVTHITRNSEFSIFIGINYPNLDDAKRGREKGLIGERTYRAIRDAIQGGQRPPQETALGGYIGIHGIGKGDPGIHAAFNWTNGCIAMTNEQITDLVDRVKPGIRVVIQ